MKHKTFRTRVALAAAGLLTMSALTACGSGAASASGSGPIVLGSLLTIDNPFWSNADVKATSEAWEKYINKELGGINGREVKIVTCDDKGDSAAGTTCANNLLAEEPVAFVNNASLVVGQVVLPQFTQAKVATLGAWPISQQENENPLLFPTTSGASGTYPGLAVYLRSIGAKNVALVFEDNGAANAVAKSLADLWKSLGGSKSRIFSYGLRTPDFTPLASQVAASKPDAVIAGIGRGDAVRVFKAFKNAGVDVPITTTQTPAVKGVLEDAGAAAEGVYFSFVCSPVSVGGEDVELYEHVMKTYAPDVELTGQTCAASSGMQYALSVLQGIKGDITKESVLAQAQNSTDWPGFMTHPMASDAAAKATPAIRNPYVTVAQYKNGEFVPVTVDHVPAGLKPYVNVRDGIPWFRGTLPAS
ncbi:ABC transporter substrate-binding protein [Streptomyces sp. NPDC091412]|uniref:ABC transporter substrate-binding protein n=1 Tax=Streptomyces sp. NPDC091412 TaxID=3366002 RepID=UPI003818EBE1